MGHAFAPSGEINNSDSDLAKEMMSKGDSDAEDEVKDHQIKKI